MEITKIHISESFGGRLDPTQFHPERMDMIYRIYSSGRCCKLKEVVNNVKTITTSLTNEDIYIGLENIESNTGKYISTSDKDSISSAAVFRTGDILFPKLRPYLNKVYRAEFAGKCSTEFHVFAAKNIDADFLTIVLRSNMVVAQTKHLMTGNTLPRLQTSDIENLIIPLPPMNVQQEIVALYTKAQMGKRVKEAQAKTFLKGINTYLLSEFGIISPQTQQRKLACKVYISEIIDGRRLDPISYKCSMQRFGNKYNLVTIGSVCIDMQSGFGAGKGEQVNEGDGIIHIRPTNIDNEGNLIFDKNIYVPSMLKRQMLSRDDVLFNNTNSQELVGKTAILKDNKELFYSNHITRIRVNRQIIIPEFLWIILNIYQREKVFYSICTNWNNQSGVGIELLKSVQIPLPSLEKQNEIVQHILAIKAQAKQLRQDGIILLTEAKAKIEKIILR